LYSASSSAFCAAAASCFAAAAAAASASHDDESGAQPAGGGRRPYGYASVRGKRPTNEDALLLGVPLREEKSEPAGENGEPGSAAHVWGVLDGHAGRRAAVSAAAALPIALRALAGCDEHGGLPSSADLVSAFEALDAQLLGVAESGGWNDGTTCLAALLAGDNLVLAQLGDAQAVLGSAFGAEELCTRHRVGDPRYPTDEDARLEAAGATVDMGRVYGGSTAVACSRSLGDRDVKVNGKGLIPTPEVVCRSLSAADEVLILGCDGVWDVLDADEAWAAVKKAGRERSGAWDYGKAAEALANAALKAGSGDNVSVVVVGLRVRKARPRISKRRGDDDE